MWGFHKCNWNLSNYHRNRLNERKIITCCISDWYQASIDLLLVYTYSHAQNTVSQVQRRLLFALYESYLAWLFGLHNYSFMFSILAQIMRNRLCNRFNSRKYFQIDSLFVNLYIKEYEVIHFYHVHFSM